MSTLGSPSSNGLSRTQLNGIIEVAQQIAGVAAFIKNEFCSGHLAASMPLYTFMKDSAQRLHSYGWPLVSELEPRKAYLPWDLRTMNAADAFLAMDQLADFFEHRANKNADPDRDDAALAADLRFLSRYTSMVTASTKEQPTSGPLTPPRSPLDGLSVLSRGPFVATKPRNDSNSTAALAPAEPVEPERPLELPAAAIQESTTISPTGETQSTGPNSPHDLRPLPGDIDHSGHALAGRRLTRRSWFQDDAHFLELIGDDHKQWIAPAPAEYATIGGGEGAFASWHYIDASCLGISAVKIIKLEHPLNAKEVRAVDIDILRFVRLMLYDWVGGHLKRPDRKAEKKSLEVVRRELAHRAWLKRRDEISAPHTPGLTALPLPAIAENEDLEPLETTPSAAEADATNAAVEATSTEPLQPSSSNTSEATEEEPDSEAQAPVPDFVTPKPDLRSLRGVNETHIDSVLRKPAPARTVLSGFCHNDGCSYCAADKAKSTDGVEATSSAVREDTPRSRTLHGPACHNGTCFWCIKKAQETESAAPEEEPAASSSNSAPASVFVDTPELSDIGKRVHFGNPIAEVHHVDDPVPSAPSEPVAVHPALLQELQQADVVDGNSLKSPVKAPSKPFVGGIGDMTELLLRSRCAALGLPTQTNKPRTEPPQMVPESSSDANRRAASKQNETESLRQEVVELQDQLAALQREVNEPLSETTPQEPAESSKKTKRTEEQDKHPLQDLIDRRKSSDTSSIDGAAGSEADLSAEWDDTLQYNTSESTTDSEPSKGRFIAPVGDVKVTTNPDGSRALQYISRPNTDHKSDLAGSLCRGEGWRHDYGSPAAARYQALLAKKRQDNLHATSLFEGDSEYRGARGPSSEERASAMAEAGLEADVGSQSPELRSSRGRPRIEGGVVLNDADDDD